MVWEEVARGIRILIGHSGVILLIVIAILRKGNILWFIDFPSAMMVFGVTFGLMLAAHPWAFVCEFPNAFGKAEMIKDKKGVAGILRSAQNYAISTAFLAVLIALINMLSRIEDSKVIGPAMSFALLSSFYGLGISKLFLLPWSINLSRISGSLYEEERLLVFDWRPLILILSMVLFFYTIFIV
jgi:flagellar motor component MotA